jgi:transposase
VLNRLNRHDLSDEEWERLRVFLPSGPQQRGGRWADHRTVINGNFFRTRAGCPWRDLPEGSGNWKTVYNRLTPPGRTAPGCASTASRRSSRSGRTRRSTAATAAGLAAFDPGWYKKRSTAERCFSKLRQFRAVATRYGKRERIYQGTIDVASVSIWLRDPVP